MKTFPSKCHFLSAIQLFSLVFSFFLYFFFQCICLCDCDITKWKWSGINSTCKASITEYLINDKHKFRHKISNSKCQKSSKASSWKKFIATSIYHTCLAQRLFSIVLIFQWKKKNRFGVIISFYLVRLSVIWLVGFLIGWK